jgi:general secretion pathway protein A
VAVAAAVLFVPPLFSTSDSSDPDAVVTRVPATTAARDNAVVAPPETVAAQQTASDIEQAVVTDTAPAPVLDDLLRNHSSSVDTAMHTLFDLWGVDFATGAGTGCAQAEAHGLSCLFQRGSWKVVQQLDRPAMLTLTDTTGATHQPVLTAIDGDFAELALGQERVRVPIDEVSALWFGEFMLLWRPPNGQTSALRRGSSGASVLWLRESLAALDTDLATSGMPADLFDAGLEQALMEFQRRNRLKVDGLAGQQTQILINSLLADENTPALSGRRR